MKMNQIMKQAQDLQKKLAQQQEQLSHKSFEGSAGGGMVVATVNGKGELLSIKLEPDCVVASEIEMLQDLIVASVNQALEKVTQAQSSEMSSMMGGLGLKLPGF